ncbi:hypothetical protein EV426DRAFT_576852 [Tirmania nivea]|nr:hypothetical protein EV426DRAFT_576852 [Tirmania nivea]
MLSRQPPWLLNLYMGLSPREFDFHIGIHKRALQSTSGGPSSAEEFKALYVVHFLATSMIMHAFPLEHYPETTQDTRPVTILKKLIWEKSKYHVDTYGADGVAQMLVAGEFLEYGRLPDGKDPAGEVCMEATRTSIHRLGDLPFEHHSRAGGLLWQMAAEKIMKLILEERKKFEEESRKAGTNVDEVRNLVGGALYDSMASLRVGQAMRWPDELES